MPPYYHASLLPCLPFCWHIGAVRRMYHNVIYAARAICYMHHVIHTMLYAACTTMLYTQHVPYVIRTMLYAPCYTHHVICTMLYAPCYTHHVIHTMLYAPCYTHHVIRTMCLMLYTHHVPYVIYAPSALYYIRTTCLFSNPLTCTTRWFSNPFPVEGLDPRKG